MRLVVATPLYPPSIGGPATYAKILCEGLPARGIEAAIVTFGDVRDMPKVVRHIAYFFRIRRALGAADALLALDPVSVGLPAMLAARSLGKPFFVKIVGDYAWEQGRQRFGVAAELDAFVRTRQSSFSVRVLQKIQTRVASAATRVIVPSVYLKRIVAAWGIPQEKIEVIYNAVSIGKIGAVPAIVSALPRPLVATAGRLVPWKNIDGVIDAVARIPGASLVVVGDGPERVALARRAREKLAARHAFTGALAHADALAVIESADAFVLNSSYEGLSHLLIEARALQTPIVARNVGGNAEVVTSESDGILVPTADAAALSAAVARALARGKGARAKSRAQRFSPDAMLDATAACITARV